MLRKCPEGHSFNKTSDCPVCPVCENQKKINIDFLKILADPARRALENNGIDHVVKLASMSESELLSLHGFGPSSLPKIKKFLEAQGLTLQNSPLL